MIFSGATGATQPAKGIVANNQWDIKVSFNTINNNNGSGTNHVSTLRGIFLNTSSTNASYNNNTISVYSGATTSQLSDIECSLGREKAYKCCQFKQLRYKGVLLISNHRNGPFDILKREHSSNFKQQQQYH